MGGMTAEEVAAIVNGDPPEPEPTPEPFAEPAQNPTALLAQKILRVMAAVDRVPKRGHNDFHGYDYATESDVADAVRHALIAHGVIMLPSLREIREREVTTRQSGKPEMVTIVTMDYRFIDAETGAELDFCMAGSGQDPGDKGLMKAITAACKNASLRSLVIATGDDPEADASTDQAHAAPAAAPGTVWEKHVTAAAPQAPPAEPAVDPDDPDAPPPADRISEAKVRYLHVLMGKAAKNKGVPLAELKGQVEAALQEHLGFSHVEYIPWKGDAWKNVQALVERLGGLVPRDVLMPTARYKLINGDPIPSVTTVISGSLGWNKGALMHWAWSEGKAGRNYRETRQTAADIGTMAHAMVEAAIHGRPYEAPADAPPEQVAKARVSFSAWDEWARGSTLRIIATEVQLVSERHRTGGTPDAIALVNGKLSLPDWKTSKGLYGEYFIQLAAYEQLWQEVTGIALVGGIHCCRFDRDTGGFSHHWYPSEALRPAWEAFLRLRDLYDLQRAVTKLAA